MPDGCRDVIWSQQRGSAPQVTLTSIDLCARSITSQKGMSYFGFRLAPAARLKNWPGGPLPDCPDALRDRIGNHLSFDLDVDAVLSALCAPGVTVAQAVRQSGLSLRSAQRKFRAAGLPPMDVWRQLARARITANKLHQSQSFADLAAEAGYSDQAHMTRALGHWFAATPRKIATDHGLRSNIAQSGFGNWTAEHSSIT